MTKEQIQLLKWIMENLAHKGFSRFEDLHLEEILGSLASPSAKLDAIIKTCSLLHEVRTELPAGYTICIGMSLRSDATPIGVTFRNVADLALEFTYDTPSIYVFEAESEPWTVQKEYAVVLPENSFPWSKNTRCSIHFEYLAPYEIEYRRSFWVVM